VFTLSQPSPAGRRRGLPRRAPGVGRVTVCASGPSLRLLPQTPAGHQLRARASAGLVGRRGHRRSGPIDLHQNRRRGAKAALAAHRPRT